MGSFSSSPAVSRPAPGFRLCPKDRKLSQDLNEHVIWHYKMTEPELVAEAQVIAPQAHLLSGRSIA